MNILNSVLPITYNQLIDFANKNNFWQVFDTAFGTQYNRSLAEILRLQWEAGDFSQLPQIEILDSSILGSANGAYASSENRIYLSNTFVASASLAAISGVLLEEIGHFVDAKINQTDSAGDEGAIFAALVQGQNLDVETLRILKAEDDHSIITLNNQQIDIEQANTTLSFPGVSGGSVTWADYNGDGKQDFLLTGYSYNTGSSYIYISKLYKNTGNGFTEDTTVSLPSVQNRSVAWADYNGDGKQDLLLTGYTGSRYISKLYKSTGNGFTEDTTVSLPDVYNGSVAWADYNGDGKQDFLLTGSTSSGYISKLYKNTGNGFTEDTTVSLPGVSYGSVTWADYNGDGKQDFLLTGYSYNTGSGGYISKLYKSTGNGFTEDTTVSLPGVYGGSVTWADYNGDGKQDLLLTGYTGPGSSYIYISKLYKNTGNGFTEDTTVSLPDVYNGSVAWADYNGDSKQDFLLTGSTGSGSISKLYKNIGNGFTEDTTVSLPGVSDGSVAWADYNGDGKQDFLLTGTTYISKLYKSTGNGFTEDITVSLPGVSGGSVAWADYNGDGKQDFLLAGSTGFGGYISKLYKSTGNGFTEDITVSLPGVSDGSVAWADYNGDGKQDFLLAGSTGLGSSYISKLYKNTGNGFTEDTTVSLPGVSDGSVTWADYNGDGKQDFLLTGSTSSGYISKLYKNTGNGFTEDTTVSLPGVSYGSVAWADYNGDGKQDFLLTGYSYNTGSGSSYISKLYKNTGNGFTEDTTVSLPGVSYGSVAWADYNGDGKQDFLLTGYTGSGYISKLYKNTGNGFTEDTTVSLPSFSYGVWADYNGDGKQDLLLTGYSYNTGSGGYFSKLYKNTGNGFTEDTTVSLPDVYNGSVTWADYNGDGKQEFLLTGITDISKLYKNTGNGFEEDINANQSDTNQAPTNITLNNSTIAENQPINTKIGNFTTIDPNTANTFTYSLVSGTGDTNNNSFIIVGNNELQTKAVFDYETKNSYSIRIKTTDQGGLSFEKQLTIGVTDVNDRTLTPITDYAPNVNISTGLIFSTNGGGNLSLDTNRLSASNEVTGVQNGTKSNFNHLFGLYEVVDAEGGINTEKGVLKPGDSDYARYALTTARVKDFIVQAGSGDTPSTATQLGSGVSLQGNKFYAPFVIANCGTYFPNLQQGVEDFIAAENGDVNRFANALQYVRDLVATEAGNEFNNAPRFVQEPVAYFSFGSANPDKSPHLRSYGNGVYGFEDLPATATQYSNNDFNDAVFALS
jgi:hypothetical protein